MPSATISGSHVYTKVGLKKYVRKRKLELIAIKDGESEDARRALSYAVQVLNDIERKIKV